MRPPLELDDRLAKIEARLVQVSLGDALRAANANLRGDRDRLDGLPGHHHCPALTRSS